jgi:transposase
MMKTSFFKRLQVIALSEQGFSQRDIVGELHIPRSIVGGILARYKEDGRVHDSPQSGRPRLLSIHDERLAVRMLNEPKSRCAAVVGRKLRAHGLRLCDETVRRCIWRQGLQFRAKRKKPLLTIKHRHKRLRWAKGVHEYEVEDWSHVIWSDKSKFNVFGSDDRQYCWKNPAEPLRDCHVHPTVKHGGGSIMVWGCMSWVGVGNLYRIDGIMNSQVYLDILDSQLLGTIERQDLDEAQMIF